MERWNRLELLVGKENNKRIQDQTVMVIGVGGVGGYATESLVRSGIHKIILVDFDRIDITNVNRQIIATTSNIGKYKTDAWEERILDMNPNCQVIKITEKIDENNIYQLISYHPDYIVDACDTISVKKQLILLCIKNQIKLISSMGTGNKLDPSKLKIIDLRKTSYDPVAKILRKMIKEENIKQKIPVICSDERPIKEKITTIPSNSFVPATAGLLCTSYIINDIIHIGENHEKN